MGLFNDALPEGLEEVDVIIAGGGAAGCVVAARLAEADPDLSILLVEGGTNNYGIESIVNPVFFLQNLDPRKKMAIYYQANKARQLADRELIVSNGGILGGGSSINFMLYTRPQRSDFDSWNTPGWSADDLLPYLQKLETYHGDGKSEHHGSDGPIQVSDGGFRHRPAEEDFLSAARKVGYPTLEDIQNLEPNNGFSKAWRYVSPDGKRQDAAHAYLHPRLRDGLHPNLHVLLESKVIRVLFDENKRACGVECTPNPAHHASVGPGPPPPRRTVRARKLVVVSCGSLGTPAVLERSGLGDAGVLGRAAVPVVAHLPGVGNAYQDHQLVACPYRVSLGPADTIDGIVSGRVDAAQVVARRDKVLGWNAMDVAGKLRPRDDEVAALGTEFQDAWDRSFKHVADKPLMLMTFSLCHLGNPASVPPGEYVSGINYSPYPYSRGHVHITGPDLSDPLDFDTGFFSDPGDVDLKTHVWAYKTQREIMRRTHFYRGELADGHPRFAPGSAAACVEVDAGLGDDDDAQDHHLVYSAEDDAAIEQWLREKVGTTWHSLGTAKMAPREGNMGGVVDQALNVHGVKGLKVADLSIAPGNVGANTYSTALMIGEKAADIIIDELNL